MTDPQANIAVCHRCPGKRRRGVLCVDTYRNISEHAAADECPRGFYPGDDGASKAVHIGPRRLPLQEIPEGWDPKDYAVDSRGTEGCNC